MRYHSTRFQKVRPPLKRTFVLLVVTLLAGYSLRSAGMPVLGPQGAAAMDAVLQDAVAKGELPGVVAAVVNKDDVLYLKAFGKQDVAKNVPMSVDTIFRIASMTKPVTSVAVMTFFEEGRLKLDDAAATLIPALKDKQVLDKLNPDGTFTTRPAKQPVTFRHLLTNTAGLAYPFSNQTMATLTSATKKAPEDLPLLFDPGTRWAYSPATALLGDMTARLASTSIEDTYQTRILRPLGMTDTSFYLPASKMPRLVTIANRKGGATAEEVNPAEHKGSLRGDGGLVSTASDYSKFVQMLLGEGSYKGTRVLKPETVRLMTTPPAGPVTVETQTTTDPSRSADFPVGAGKDKFGLGFQITATDGAATGERGIGSYTWAGIWNTFFWVDPKNGVAVVFLTQVLPFYNSTNMGVMNRFEKALYQNLKQ
jgi:CubicO group peptidase (beta-lactamase class C family)